MSSETICVAVGEHNYSKKVTPSGRCVHDYGDMVMAKRTPLNILLQKYNMLQDPLVIFLGHFDRRLAVFNKGRFDEMDVQSGEREKEKEKEKEKEREDLIAGQEYTVKVTKWCSEFRFTHYIDGPFYKWQSRNGFFLVLLQEEVDTLTEREKVNLKIV
uniref:Uncharacterized protein n=1 Tax=viral metagenome TaxID=1070528 RepID=A0A6C0LFP2_9ZZZZ